MQASLTLPPEQLSSDELVFLDFTTALFEWLAPYHDFTRPPPPPSAAEQTKQKTGQPVKAVEAPPNGAGNGHKKGEECPAIQDAPEAVMRYFDSEPLFCISMVKCTHRQIQTSLLASMKFSITARFRTKSCMWSTLLRRYGSQKQFFESFLNANYRHSSFSQWIPQGSNQPPLSKSIDWVLWVLRVMFSSTPWNWLSSSSFKCLKKFAPKRVKHSSTCLPLWPHWRRKRQPLRGGKYSWMAANRSGNPPWWVALRYWNYFAFTHHTMS